VTRRDKATRIQEVQGQLSDEVFRLAKRLASTRNKHRKVERAAEEIEEQGFPLLLWLALYLITGERRDRTLEVTSLLEGARSRKR
jgi:hypothetical protein